MRQHLKSRNARQRFDVKRHHPPDEISTKGKGQAIGRRLGLAGHGGGLWARTGLGSSHLPFGRPCTAALARHDGGMTNLFARLPDSTRKIAVFSLFLTAKIAVFLALFALILPAQAAAPRKAARQPVAARPAPPADTAPRVRVILTTAAGPIIVEVDREHAPITAGNFLRYVDQKRFDGTVFYRSMKLWADENGQVQGLIQGGTQNDPKRILKPIAHEPTNITGLRHTTGALSMARWAPGTATGDFSILVGPLSGLDADPNRPKAEEPEGYAVFGYVVEGMDVVRKIHEGPVSTTKGEGALKGQMLEPVVRIITARRAPIAAITPAPPQ